MKRSVKKQAKSATLQAHIRVREGQREFICLRLTKGNITLSHYIQALIDLDKEKDLLPEALTFRFSKMM